MTPHHLTTLVLMQREHARLDDQASQLRSYILNLHDLYVLEQHWKEHLGFIEEAKPLITSLTYLIQQQEQGNCSEKAYANVIQQISIYRFDTRGWVSYHFGRITPYLISRGQLDPLYEQKFQDEFETNRPLSVTEQAAMLRRLYLTVSNLDTD